jgi:hypothetical protein
MRYEGLGRAFRCGHCQSELQPVCEPVDVHNDLAFETLIAYSGKVYRKLSAILVEVRYSAVPGEASKFLVDSGV